MARVAVACISAAGEGSVAAAARWQAKVLSTKHDVFLVSDSLPDDMEGVQGVLVKRPEYRWLRRLAHVPSEVVFSLRLQQALVRVDAARSIDLVVYNNHSLLGVRIPPALRRISAVMVTHADIFDRPRRTYDWRVVAFYKWVARRAYSFASVVAANSAYTAERVRAVVPEARIEVVYVPVSLSDIDGGTELPESLTGLYRNGLFRILFVGRLVHEKGLDVLLDACRILVERSFPIELVIVGSGPLAGSLQKIRETLSGDVIVNHIPWQPRSSLGALYRSADVLCVPSRRESLGLVAIEALLCGLPVVASDVGGLRDVVRAGVDGELVPPEDPAAFADAVSRVAKRRECRLHQPDWAWLKRFSPEAVGKKLLSLVGRCIE